MISAPVSLPHILNYKNVALSLPSARKDCLANRLPTPLHLVQKMLIVFLHRQKTFMCTCIGKRAALPLDRIASQLIHTNCACAGHDKHLSSRSSCNCCSMQAYKTTNNNRICRRRSAKIRICNHVGACMYVCTSTFTRVSVHDCM